jgi:lipid II:glycine glycyltransferase (peptidoglycan interpeptide bridge formation enzyme)
VTSFVFLKEGEDIAGAHYIIKESTTGLIKTADILSGIIFKNEPDSETISYILEHFINWAKGKRASFMRFNPWVPLTIQGQKPIFTELFYKNLKKYGFEPLTKGMSTYWIDLTLSEEKLLQNMNPGTRSKIRKAMNSGIEVEVLRKPDQKIIHVFWQLYCNLGKRKDFNLLSEKRFKEEVTVLMDNNQADMFILRFSDVIVNIALVSNFSNSMYFHGAVNPEYKTLERCPPPGHFAQWIIITYMKSLGLKIYDMAFCPGAVPYENHPDFDMWRFKHSFGGMYVEFIPVYGKILKPVRGKIFRYMIYNK